MALIRCRECAHEEATGCMPTTSCGLLVLPPLAATVYFAPVLWRTLGWLSLLVLPSLAVVLMLGVHWIPYSLEYALAFRKKCPACGARRWSFPYTSGFGL